ncbi:MAG: nitroreductase family protein [Thermodesulfobacteriota bacterium]|nr:nitroreductase family protein [Thermodesulfobacteriota bacterium]
MFLSLVRERRSVRKYLTRPVEADKIDLLVEAALRSPSSRGFNPWQFIVVTAPEVLDKLSRAKPHGAGFLKNAPLGIVVCGLPSVSDVWIEDCSIASIFIHLAAQSLGLGSCWIQIRERMYDQSRSSEAYVRDLLSIPETVKVESMVAIGYRDEEKAPHKKEALEQHKVFFEVYGRAHRPLP